MNFEENLPRLFFEICNFKKVSSVNLSQIPLLNMRLLVLIVKRLKVTELTADTNLEPRRCLRWSFIKTIVNGL